MILHTTGDVEVPLCATQEHRNTRGDTYQRVRCFNRQFPRAKHRESHERGMFCVFVAI